MADLDRRGLPLLSQLVPDNAPFDEEQRAWLNGFLAGLLGSFNGSEQVPAQGADARTGPALPPWRDPALPLEQRLALAAGEDLERRLCAALAQLDCGQCGSSCESYARSLASRSEKKSGLCVPGGRATARAIEMLLLEQSQPSPVSRALPAGGAQPGPNADAGRIRSTPEAAQRNSEAPSGTIRVRLKSHRKLTHADAGAEIREVVLERTDGPLSYHTGDSLAVFPQNDPDLVRALLRALGARGQESVATPAGPREAWRCLLEDFDITHVRRETLELFARETKERGQAGTLRELMERGVPPGFDLLDLLAACPSARPGMDQLIETLPRLQPRLYWIACSHSTHPAEIQLAVRLVRAERGGRERKGVASHFLADGILRNDPIVARVQGGGDFALNEGARPMILLAAGTGIARYRAYLEELAARGRRGETWLIFASHHEGDRSLYQPELELWSRQGVLEHLDVLDLASRGRRLGPGDILRKRARRLVSWLERGAAIYVCGEGGALGSGLREVLAEILGRREKWKADAATDLVQTLKREGRFFEELY